LVLPHKGGVSIVGLIGPFLGTDKAALNHLLNHYFKGLAVPLKQSEQQPRQHGKNHQQGRTSEKKESTRKKQYLILVHRRQHNG